MTIEEQIKDTEYYQYANDVVNGNIVAGKLIKLACKRFISDCKRDDLYFNQKRVEKFFKFCSLFRHYKSNDCGSLGNQFVLEPWQKWVMANIIGFYYKESDKRRFNTAILCLARKNGKTALSAVIALWFMFDEEGASVALAANSRSQAQLAFDDVSKFASQIDPKQKGIKRYRNSLKCDLNTSRLKVFAADSTRLDGENLSMCLIDEYHAAKDNSVYAVLRSSMTSRPNPLMLVISTVGFNLQGPMKKMYDTDVEILHGLKEDDNRFIAIYQMDESDDWEDEKNWIKHSPNLGVSISYDNLRKAQIEAKNNPTTLNETLTKNWNVWCSVSECWINNDYINTNTSNIDLNEFNSDNLCYVGIDLAATSDLTCLSLLLTKDDDEKLYFKNYYYLPESCLTESPNRELYKYWVQTNQLKLTPGNVTDYDFVLNDLMNIYNNYTIIKVGYDAWNATQFVIKATENGLPMEPISQSISNLSRPTKTLERLVKMNNVVLDNNEITRWCFQNVAIKSDWNENIKCTKGSGKDSKIDGVIAIIMALTTYLDTPRYNGGIMTI